MPEGVVVSAAVEGVVDEAVVRRLISHVGATAGEVYGKRGKAYLRDKIAGYNNAARTTPWIVLVDLDSEEECAPPLRDRWLPKPAAGLCFRVAVREVESWLLADDETLAAFLGVARSRVPADPEQVEDPKGFVVNLARTSRRRAIRQDMVPRARARRPVGPAYSSRLIEFVAFAWRPDVAAERSNSLRRAIACLQNLT